MTNAITANNIKNSLPLTVKLLKVNDTQSHLHKSNMTIAKNRGVIRIPAPEAPTKIIVHQNEGLRTWGNKQSVILILSKGKHFTSHLDDIN